MTAGEPLSAGALLRRAREAAGLSVEDVSASTKIRATVVRHLEEDRLDTSGGLVYARGHVRNIAKAVGADPERVLACFDGLGAGAAAEEPPEPAQRSPVPPPLVPRPVRPVQPKATSPESLGAGLTSIGGMGSPLGRTERRGPNWAVAGVAALAILVALIGLGSLGSPSNPAATADLATLGAPSAAATPSPSPPAVPRPLLPAAVAQLAPSGEAQLRIRTVGGASWIQVRSPLATLFEGVLPDGASRDFRDPKQLRVVVGNAGAVSLVCGGHDLGPVGGPGQIGHFTCGPAGLVAA